MSNEITIFAKYPEVVAKLWQAKPTDAEVKEAGADQLVVIHQIHGNLIQEVERGLTPPPDGDALISHEPGLLLAMRVADCVAVLLYDPKNKIVAAVHSGWRGSKAEIVPKTIQRLKDEFGTDPADLLAYISPAGQTCCYEVGPEFKDYFPEEYFEERDGKLYFDNSGLVYAQLTQAGLNHGNIEWDERCTIHDPSFLSYRRTKTSERMFVAIGLSSRP